MSKFSEQAAAELEKLPEDVQEAMLARIMEQTERFRLLKAVVDDGLRAAEDGRVRAWDFDSFLMEANGRRSD